MTLIKLIIKLNIPIKVLQRAARAGEITTRTAPAAVDKWIPSRLSISRKPKQPLSRINF